MVIASSERGTADAGFSPAESFLLRPSCKPTVNTTSVKMNTTTQDFFNGVMLTFLLKLFGFPPYFLINCAAVLQRSCAIKGPFNSCQMGWKEQCDRSLHFDRPKTHW